MARNIEQELNIQKTINENNCEKIKALIKVKDRVVAETEYITTESLNKIASEFIKIKGMESKKEGWVNSALGQSVIKYAMASIEQQISKEWNKCEEISRSMNAEDLIVDASKVVQKFQSVFSKKFLEGGMLNKFLESRGEYMSIIKNLDNTEDSQESLDIAFAELSYELRESALYLGEGKNQIDEQDINVKGISDMHELQMKQALLSEEIMADL